MGSLLEYAITGPCRFRGKYESTGLEQGCGVGLLAVTQYVPRRPYTEKSSHHPASGDGGTGVSCPPSPIAPALPGVPTPAVARACASACAFPPSLFLSVDCDCVKLTYPI